MEFNASLTCIPIFPESVTESVVTTTSPIDGVTYSVAVVFGIFATFGLLIYFLVFCAIVVNYKKLKSIFYIHVLALGFCDNCVLLVNLIYVVPSLTLQKDVYSSNTFILSIFQIVGRQGQSLFLFIIALNRCINFAGCSECCRKGQIVVAETVSVLAILFILVITNELTTCHNAYDLHSFAWNFQCTDSTAATVWKRYTIVVLYVLPILATVLYVTAWLFVKEGHHEFDPESAARNREIRFLTQFSIIAGCVLVEVVLYIIFAECILYNRVVQVVLSILMIARSFINPIVCLVWDKYIKVSVLSFFLRKIIPMPDTTLEMSMM